MIYFITYSLVVLGLIKKSKFLYVIQIIWLFLIMSGNYSNPDYESYLYRYQMISPDNWINQQEIIFDYMMLLLKNLNFTYQSFLYVYFGLSIFILAYAIRKISRFPNIILSLFMLYPLIDSIIQIRTFMSLAIFVFAFQFLLNDQKKSDFLYVICVLIASGFHNLSLFYLLFLIAKHFNLRKCILISFILMASITFLFILFPNIDLPFINDKIVDRYFSETTNRITLFKVFLLMIWQLCGLLCLLKFKTTLFHNSLRIQSITENQQLNLVIKMNVLLLSITPLYAVTSLFTRIYRNLMVINYITVSSLISKAKVFDYIIYILYAVLSLIYFNMVSNNMFELIYKTVFENNVFFN